MTATKYLQHLFKKYNSSVNGIARIAKINGGILSQYMNGKREIKDFDTYVRIAKAMGVSDREYTRLCDLYFTEVYSSSELDAAKTIIAELPCVMKDASVFPVKKSADIPTDGCLANKEQIDSAIVSLCENANGNIYTNIPFTDKAIDDCLFSLSQKENINLIRFFETSDDAPDTDDIRALMSTFRFFRYECFPYIVAKSHGVDNTDIFPYFVVTENGFVMCNESFGILSSDAQATRKIAEKVEKIRASAKQFGKRLENILDLVSFGGTDINKPVETGYVSAFPCVGPYLTRDDIAASANDVPNKDALIDICYAHYSHIGVCDIAKYTTQKGIFDFARTGNIYSIPPMFVHGLPAKNRLDVLDRIAADIENDTLFIINTDVLSIPDEFIMDYEGADVALTAFDSSVDQFFNSDIYHKTNSPYYMKLAKLFLQYLKNGRYTYDKQAALHIVECAKELAV